MTFISKKVPFLRTLTEVGVSGGELVSLFLLSGLCENTFFNSCDSRISHTR